MLKRYRMVIVSCGLITVIISALLILAGLHTLNEWVYGSTPRVLPTYSPLATSSICKIFQLSPNDVFCRPTTTHNLESLEEALKVEYSNTYYQDLVILLTEFNSGPSPYCESKTQSNFGFAKNNCPPPEKCSSSHKIYECSYAMLVENQPIGLNVLISRDTGLISDFIIERPGNS